MNRFVVVGLSPNTYRPWGDSVFVSPVTGGNRMQCIKDAMSDAVRLADPGDVICQYDIRFYDDPFTAPSCDGVRTFTPMRPDHCCPQAFTFYTDTVRQQILDAWQVQFPVNACVSWADISKTDDVLVASHDGWGC